MNLKLKIKSSTMLLVLLALSAGFTSVNAIAEEGNCIVNIEEDVYACSASSLSLYDEDKVFAFAADYSDRVYYDDMTCETRDRIVRLLNNSAQAVSVAILAGSVCTSLATGGASFPVGMQVAGLVVHGGSFLANMYLKDMECDNSRVEEEQREQIENTICQIMSKKYGIDGCKTSREQNQCLIDEIDPFLRRIINGSNV